MGPRKIDTEDFLEGQDNPGKEFSIRVIRDVIGDLQTDFQRDGVPEEVLELLERSWLLRLKIGPLKHDKPSPQSKSVVSKILQFDGPADTSSSDSDEVEVEVKDKSNSTAEDDDIDDISEVKNVVFCQYDKIWKYGQKQKSVKFVLKDGIMNLNGEDHIFKKAYGEAEDVNQ